VDFGGKEPIPGGTESLDRFVRGAYYLRRVPTPTSFPRAVAYGFDVIQTVTETPGFDEFFTQWSVVSDITNKKVYFRTAWNPQVCFLDLNKVDFSAGRPVRYLDFITQDNLCGNVLASFSAKPPLNNSPAK
jgi:choloylglycine hydrolase